MIWQRYILITGWLPLLVLPVSARAAKTQERVLPAKGIAEVVVHLTSGDIKAVGWDEEKIKLVAEPGISFEVVGEELRISSDKLREARMEAAQKTHAQAAAGRDDKKHEERGSSSDEEEKGLQDEVDSFEAEVETLVREALSEARHGNALFGRDSDVALWVPKRMLLSLSTVSGDLQATDIRARLDLSTISGDIRVRRCAGPVNAESVSGDMHVDGLNEDVMLKTVSGDVDVRDVNSLLFEAKSVSGDIDVLQSKARNVRISSQSADVRFQGEITQAGTMEVKTFSGSVRVQVPPGSLAICDAESLSGSIDCGSDMKTVQRSRHHVRARGATTGPELRAKSFSGDITVK